MALSSDSETSLPDYSAVINKVTTSTNIDIVNLSDSKDAQTETSPEVCLTLETQKPIYLSTLGTQSLGQFKIPKTPNNLPKGRSQTRGIQIRHELKKIAVTNLPVNHSPVAGPPKTAEQKKMTVTNLPANHSPEADPSKLIHSKQTNVTKEGTTPPS